jgi:hypothetical protein
MAPWSRQSLDNAPNYAAAPHSGNNSQNSRALNRLGSWRWRSFRGCIPSITVRDFTNLQWQPPSRSKESSTSMRGYVIACAQIACIWLSAGEAPVNILFVGNSFTHGRYEPLRTYNAGFGTDSVHDLLIEGTGLDVWCCRTRAFSRRSR